MEVNLSVSKQNLNKNGEELCGDTAEIIKTEDSDIVILSDGMGSGVRANILSTLTTSILGTMLKNGESIDDCVETIALTLPIDPVRHVAYSTMSILQIYRDGKGKLVEYDAPACIIIRDGKRINLPYVDREIAGKMIREYDFEVQKDDFFILMSDGATHAGVGGKYGFGWGNTRIGEYVEALFTQEDVSCARIASAIIEECKDLYDQRPGDDTTIIVAGVSERRDLNIFTGPPKKKEFDTLVMQEYMGKPGYHVVSGGTSATICSRYLGKPIIPSLFYSDPDIPPTAEIEGLDLVTEGVLTLNRTVQLLQEYNAGAQTEQFFVALDDENGGAQLAKMIIEKCTHLSLFVGTAMNPAHQAAGLPFDLSIRMRLVDRIIEESKKMGKVVSVKYY